VSAASRLLLESVLPKGVKPLDVSSATQTSRRYDRRLLGGVVVLEGVVQSPHQHNLERSTISQTPAAKPMPVKLQLIPIRLGKSWARPR